VVGVRDPVLEWARGGVHELLDKPPYHVRCRCEVKEIIARGERWEVTKTRRNPPWPCEWCVEKREIWKWLAKHGDRRIAVSRLALHHDRASFHRVYGYLCRLMDELPSAVPTEGIVLSFEPGALRTDFSGWDERQHCLRLSGDYFGNAQDLARLEHALAGYEAMAENPAGCHSPEYLVAHEFGHCLWYRLDTGKYERWWLLSEVRQICRNARAGPKEGFAEGFAAMRQTPAERWPAAVEDLHRMLREDGVL